MIARRRCSGLMAAAPRAAASSTAPVNAARASSLKAAKFTLARLPAAAMAGRDADEVAAAPVVGDAGPVHARAEVVAERAVADPDAQDPIRVGIAAAHA